MDRQLLIREVTGETTPAESVYVRAWAAADPDNSATLDALRTTWDALGATPPAGPYDVNNGWDQLRGTVATCHAQAASPKLTLHSGRAERELKPSLARRLTARVSAWPDHPARFLASLGAACAIGIVVGLLLRDNRPAPARRVAHGGVREVMTGNAQRASIELADGSRVLLGVRSTLRTPAHFGSGARDVELDGEAYFDVRHDDARPFRVHAGGAVMRDLGTRFTVRAYSGESAVRVAVEDGEVSVGDSGSANDTGPPVPVDVGRGQLAEISPGTAPSVHSVNLEPYLAWTQGRLVFDATPLSQAVAQLGRWYDLDVRLANPALGERHVTGSFKDEPPGDVLHVIASAVGLRYERRGNVVTFYAPRIR